MSKFVTVVVLFVFTLQHATNGSPFLNTLLSTTSVPSHISDFRKQPRSDSRADKPDSFPNFDFTIETTTIRRKTAAELYTQLFGKIVGNTRQRFGKIIENVEQNHEKREQIRKLDAKNKAAYFEKLQVKPESTTEFQGLNLDDDFEEDKNEAIVLQQPLTNKLSTGLIGIASVPNKFFSSILQGVSLNKLQNSFGVLRNNVTNGIVATSTTYFINPLVNAWNVATKNLNLNSLNPISKRRIEQTEEDEFSNGNINGYASLPYQSSSNDNAVAAATDPDFTSSKDDGTDDGDDDDDENAVVVLVDDSTNDGNIKMRAKLAFGNAFYKYLNLMSKGYYNNKTDSFEGGSSGSSSNSSTGEIPLGKANLNNKTMEFNADFPIERIDVNDNDEDDGDGNNGGGVGDDNENTGGNTNAENVGIFVLEIFGTIAGLGWGAISQIQNIFTRD